MILPFMRERGGRGLGASGTGGRAPSFAETLTASMIRLKAACPYWPGSGTKPISSPAYLSKAANCVGTAAKSEKVDAISRLPRCENRHVAIDDLSSQTG